jgi:hypothetical protein
MRRADGHCRMSASGTSFPARGDSADMTDGILVNDFDDSFFAITDLANPSALSTGYLGTLLSRSVSLMDDQGRVVEQRTYLDPTSAGLDAPHAVTEHVYDDLGRRTHTIAADNTVQKRSTMFSTAPSRAGRSSSLRAISASPRAVWSRPAAPTTISSGGWSPATPMAMRAPSSPPPTGMTPTGARPPLAAPMAPCACRPTITGIARISAPPSTAGVRWK